MRYAAFISYSNVDRAMGERIQRALESYVVPAPLRGQDFGRGPLPRRISPIFRDRWDADASGDLGATLRAALHASDALIVLCSPAAARSSWVGEEIRTFRRAGREERIYPVLVAGDPASFDPERHPQGAFPPALFESRSEGAVDQVSVERVPLAPDVRDGGDGLRFTVLKLVAALTGVPLTTLTQRQAEAERQARNRARWVAGAMSVLAIAAAGGAWLSWQATVEARMRLENAVEMAARRVDDAAGFQDRYGVPRTVINELLSGAQRDFDELTREAPATPMLALQRARLHRLFAQLYEVAGDTAQHNAMALRALEALARLPTMRRIEAPETWFAQLPAPSNVQIERLLALDVLGQAKAADGDLPGARSTFEEMAREADALLETSAQVSVRSLAANARSHLARLSYESGDLDKALVQYREAASILASSAANSKIALELAKIQSDEAEMLLELGRHAEALARQQVAVSTLENPSARTPENARALAAALARRGDMRLGAHRDLDGARADYVTARSMLAELLASDGARTDFKRDLSLVHERVGDALLQAHDVDGAREAFLACLALRRELLARDASNPEWRRDLSVALERIGQVESLRGRHDAASAAFAEALRLRQAALEDSAGDVVAARDLAILLMQVGKARHGARAKLPEIEAAYGRAIELLQALVEKSAAESRWRRDLAVAYAERGEARRNAGKLSGARSDTRAALALITDLRAAAPDDAQLAKDESWLRQRLRR